MNATWYELVEEVLAPVEGLYVVVEDVHLPVETLYVVVEDVFEVVEGRSVSIAMRSALIEAMAQ